MDHGDVGELGAVLVQRGLHLGVLVDVALYDDDRQIRRLSYVEEPAEDFSYQVRVAAVPTVV